LSFYFYVFVLLFSNLLFFFLFLVACVGGCLALLCRVCAWWLYVSPVAVNVNVDCGGRR
jgi:hypothetical protein